MFVAGLHEPLQAANALEVLGPRPKITAVRRSFSTNVGTELRDGEVPAGAPASFAIDVEHLEGRPTLELRCREDRNTKQVVTIQAGQKTPAASLDTATEGSLFLSTDPGVIGQSGCDLMAVVQSPETGASDPYAIAHVLELPLIESFTIGDTKSGDSLYAATLTGRNLQTIDKVGWDTKTGIPVQGIPTPMPDAPGKQTLSISIGWPSPSPHAPLYVWLRGEKEARRTTSHY